eukprot:COSAG01_NODE_67463_length_267_cov_0.595238_1_plen_35_part_10
MPAVNCPAKLVASFNGFAPFWGAERHTTGNVVFDL